MVHVYVQSNLSFTHALTRTYTHRRLRTHIHSQPVAKDTCHIWKAKATQTVRHQISVGINLKVFFTLEISMLGFS